MKKVIKFSGSSLLLGFFFLFAGVFSYAQTKDDLRILRAEILSNMQSKDQNVEDLLKYYSKISTYEASILNIKYLLLKGDYENALDKIFLLKLNAENDKTSDRYFQYQCIYVQVCLILGLSSEVENTRKNIQNSPFLKGSGFTDLALDQTAFDIFPIQKRVAILESSIDYYTKKNDVQSKIQSYVWLAEILRTTNINTSHNALEKALSLNHSSSLEIPYQFLMENTKAKFLINEKQETSAFKILQKYSKDISKISSITLRLDYYKNLALSSAMVAQMDELQLANDELVKITEQDNAQKSSARAILVNHINKNNEEKLKSQQEFFNYLYITIAILFLLGTLLIFLWYKKKAKKLNNKAYLTPDITSVMVTDVKNYIIPDKTEKRILSKLDAFEKSQKYIQKNISLKNLAQQFETNPKYLSEVINNHKNSNFNTYINNLRIDYIVDKIKQDPEYRKYKVSYLADECGFSSHSLFTTIFKNRMNLSPTEFLQSLNE